MENQHHMHGWRLAHSLERWIYAALKKDFYKSWWKKEKVIHLFLGMGIEEGIQNDYYVFSNAEEVELIVNGQSLGRKKCRKRVILYGKMKLL